MKLSRPFGLLVLAAWVRHLVRAALAAFRRRTP